MGSNMDKIYIVMNYVEHDLKSLMETMKQPFLPGRRGPSSAVHVVHWPCPRGLAVLGSPGCRLCPWGQKGRWLIALSRHTERASVDTYVRASKRAGRTGLGALAGGTPGTPSGCRTGPSGQLSAVQQPQPLSPVACRGGEDADDPAAAGCEAPA